MRTWLRGKFTLLFITCAVVLAIPAVALADTTISDGDDLAPIADSDMDLGSVCSGVESSKSAPVFINRNGAASTNVNNNVFANGSTATVTITGVTGAGLTAQMDASPATITLPNNWDSLANNTKSASVSSTVKLTSSATGPGTGTVTYTATGTNAGGGTVTRTDTMNVKWTTANCDTTAPTVTASAVKGDAPDFTGATTYTADTWTNKDVKVTFTCADNDGGSGLTAASGGQVKTFTTNTSVSGTTASFDGTCVDNAGNTAAASNFGPIKIDKTNPLVALVDGPANGSEHYFGSVPAAPTCDASDALSGLTAAGCVVSGYGTTVGEHTVTASATDNAGNSNSASNTYKVLAWTTKGFYAPVDMNGVFNTVKGGSTVPLKFELFAGSELTDTSAIKSLTYAKVNCDGSAPTDDIETVATGGTSLRYDSTGGQFIYNWKTPTGQGCYKVTMLAQDGSTISALFKTK